MSSNRSIIHTVTTKHAVMRSTERYGKGLTPEEAKRIVTDILENRAVYLMPGATQRTCIMAVLLDGKAVPIVYDKKSRTIVTVLPRKSILNMLTKRIMHLTTGVI